MDFVRKHDDLSRDNMSLMRSPFAIGSDHQKLPRPLMWSRKNPDCGLE
ncbi:MAG TPA: hypothetical protein VK211_27395 [Kamptonema sp.]|nr:hypothetical protein [Kamptonema sp.]